MKISHSVIISLILLLSATTAHSATYYFHNDHLGTPQVLTDENQAVVWKGTYDPFGKVTETVATVEQNLRFPGQYLDRESGLHYNYFRTYDPGIGRYVESDPIGLEGGLSTYGYVYQNPNSYSDPYGLFGIDSVYGAVYKMTGGWSPSQEMVDRAAGFGDGLSGGLTAWARDGAGIDGVNECSAAYSSSRTTGNLATLTMGGGRLAYAALAKGYSVAASSGAAASAGRHSLRRLFGNSGSLRRPNLSKYNTDAALRAAAGRTNPYFNVAGAATAGLSANDLRN